MLERLRRIVGMSSTPEDVEPDPNLANARPTGGRDADHADSSSTTGVGDSGEFVGRVSGQDEGFAEETGAEIRSPDEPTPGGSGRS